MCELGSNADMKKNIQIESSNTNKSSIIRLFLFIAVMISYAYTGTILLKSDYQKVMHNTKVSIIHLQKF